MVAVSIEPRTATVGAQWCSFVAAFLLDKEVAVKDFRFPEMQLIFTSVGKFKPEEKDKVQKTPYITDKYLKMVDELSSIYLK